MGTPQQSAQYIHQIKSTKNPANQLRLQEWRLRQTSKKTISKEIFIWSSSYKILVVF